MKKENAKMAIKIEKAIQERQTTLDKTERKKSISHRNLSSGLRGVGENDIVNIQVSEHTGEVADTEEFQTIEMTHSARIDHNSQSEPEKCYP